MEALLDRSSNFVISFHSLLIKVVGKGLSLTKPPRASRRGHYPYFIFHRGNVLFYPGYTLAVEEIRAKDVAESILTGKNSFALAPDTSATSGLDFKLLYNDFLILCVPVRYNVESLATVNLQLPIKQINIADVAELDFVMQEPNTDPRKRIERICAEADVSIKPVKVFPTSLMTLRACQQQIGCCIVAKTSLYFLSDLSKMRYYIISNNVFSTCGIVSPAEYKFNAREKCAIQLIQECIENDSVLFEKRFSAAMKQENNNR